MLKQENRKVERARKAEEQAADLMEQMIPKMEATCASLSEFRELTADQVVESMVIEQGPIPELGRKIIRYQAKEKAI